MLNMKTIKALKQQINNITKDGSVEGRIYFKYYPQEEISRLISDGAFKIAPETKTANSIIVYAIDSGNDWLNHYGESEREQNRYREYWIKNQYLNLPFPTRCQKQNDLRRLYQYGINYEFKEHLNLEDRCSFGLFLSAKGIDSFNEYATLKDNWSEEQNEVFLCEYSKFTQGVILTQEYADGQRIDYSYEDVI